MAEELELLEREGEAEVAEREEEEAEVEEAEEEEAEEDGDVGDVIAAGRKEGSEEEATRAEEEGGAITVRRAFTSSASFDVSIEICPSPLIASAIDAALVVDDDDDEEDDDVEAE